MQELLRFAGAVARDPRIDDWLNSPPDAALRALASTWFRRIRECGDDVRELLHDGLATLCVDDAPFAYVGVFRAHVSVGFFRGSELPDPAGLLEGSGRHMRHTRLRPGQAIDETALAALVVAAHEDIRVRLARGD